MEPQTDTDRPRPGNPDAMLRRLEERLERASEAAERLFGQAASEATSAAVRRGSRRPAEPPAPAESTPSQGWQIPGQDPPQSATELDALLAAWGAMRELVPPELRRRLADAITELLTAVRALIDWYLERLERPPREPIEVQDIPIL